MLKFLKIGLMVFPWIGMAVLGFLYLGTYMNLSAADHYSSQTFRDMASHQEVLTDYTKSRRDFENDEMAFQNLGLILANQNDGKYEPWLNTKMGLVKFDAEGFIVAICSPSTGLNNPECPPQL